MNVLSLFDGIGCGKVALNRAGVSVNNYFASEIDAHAISVCVKNNPSVLQVGDVKNLNACNLPKIDLLLGGSPCQGFSFAGKQLNFSDSRSALFFEYVRLLVSLKPKYFLLENTKMKQEFQDVVSNFLGVAPVRINSALFSAQNRERLYWTNIPIAPTPESGPLLCDIVGPNCGVWVYPRGFNKGGVQSYKGKSPTITTSSWEHNFFIARPDGTKDDFTPEICERLQTLPIGYTDNLSKSKRIKAIGNGWTVDVIAHILKGVTNPNV